MKLMKEYSNLSESQMNQWLVDKPWEIVIIQVY